MKDCTLSSMERMPSNVLSFYLFFYLKCSFATCLWAYLTSNSLDLHSITTITLHSYSNFSAIAMSISPKFLGTHLQFFKTLICLCWMLAILQMMGNNLFSTIFSKQSPFSMPSWPILVSASFHF